MILSKTYNTPNEISVMIVKICKGSNTESGIWEMFCFYFEIHLSLNKLYFELYLLQAWSFFEETPKCIDG